MGCFCLGNSCFSRKSPYRWGPHRSNSAIPSQRIGRFSILMSEYTVRIEPLSSHINALPEGKLKGIPPHSCHHTFSSFFLLQFPESLLQDLPSVVFIRVHKQTSSIPEIVAAGPSELNEMERRVTRAPKVTYPMMTCVIRRIIHLDLLDLLKCLRNQGLSW